jgi:hypothetical protein
LARKLEAHLAETRALKAQLLPVPAAGEGEMAAADAERMALVREVEERMVVMESEVLAQMRRLEASWADLRALRHAERCIKGEEAKEGDFRSDVVTDVTVEELWKALRLTVGMMSERGWSLLGGSGGGGGSSRVWDAERLLEAIAAMRDSMLQQGNLDIACSIARVMKAPWTRHLLTNILR